MAEHADVTGSSSLSRNDPSDRQPRGALGTAAVAVVAICSSTDCDYEASVQIGDHYCPWCGQDLVPQQVVTPGDDAGVTGGGGPA